MKFSPVSVNATGEDTYTTMRLACKGHVCTDVDVQLIRAWVTAPLIYRHLCLAEIVCASGRTSIDDLHSDGVSLTADTTANSSNVGHLVALPTVRLRTTGSCITSDCALSGAL